MRFFMAIAVGQEVRLIKGLSNNKSEIAAWR